MKRMFKYNLAYRYQNNEVEGFVGYGLTKEGAYNNAVHKIKDKLQSFNETFVVNNAIMDFSGLSEEEVRFIKDDWMLKSE